LGSIRGYQRLQAESAVEGELADGVEPVLEGELADGVEPVLEGELADGVEPVPGAESAMNAERAAEGVLDLEQAGLLQTILKKKTLAAPS
jgi:hypothetical protein